MFVDECQIKTLAIQHGTLGFNGELGYDNLWSQVNGRSYSRSLSAHPPSLLEISVGAAEHFSCSVALCDTSYPHNSADFYVYADGVLMAVVENVKPFSAPRPISFNTNGAKKIELSCQTHDPIMCHAIWIDPVVSNRPATRYVGVLGSSFVYLPLRLDSCEKCIATVITPNYISNADDMLGSLFMNGCCQDATVLMFCPEPNKEIKKLAEKYNAQIVSCHISNKDTFNMKSLLYGVAQIICADQYLLLDSDMMILGDISQIFSSMESLDSRSVFVCREQTLEPGTTLKKVFSENIRPYYSEPTDIIPFNLSVEEELSNLIINGGVIAASRRAILGLESTMRSLMPAAAIWEKSKPSVLWREQAILNLALIRRGNCVELAESYNCQLLAKNPELKYEEGYVEAVLEGAPVKIIHFNGITGKDKYQRVRGKFGYVNNPKFGYQDAHEFLHFHKKINWFAKTYSRSTRSLTTHPFAETIYRRLPLYKTLYEELDNTQAVHVLEIGTRTGIGTICIASSISKRNGLITTVDDEENTDRDYLLKLFPEDISSVVKQHIEDIPIFIQKISKGNVKFDAVVMDTESNKISTHSNLLMALNIISDNGIVYIQDVDYPACDVEYILENIKSRGYHYEILKGIKEGSKLIRLIAISPKKVQR